MHHTSTPPLVAVIPLIAVVFLIVIGSMYMKRKGYYETDGKDVVVRCRQGHLFTTIWIPFVSFKAARLGPVRYQHCPVGNHWSFVDIVNASELTDAERRFAAEHHDTQIP